MNPKAVPVNPCFGVHVFESEIIIIIHILSNYFIHHIDYDLYLRTRFRSIHTESTFFLPCNSPGDGYGGFCVTTLN